jgi:hypothetical protein
MVLTLRLSVVGTDVSCAKHGMASNSAATMDMGSRHHAATNGATGATKDEGSPDIPTAPECCRALASCAVNALGQPTELVALMPVRVDRPTDDTDSLQSRLVAPETPPPRV